MAIYIFHVVNNSDSKIKYGGAAFRRLAIGEFADRISVIMHRMAAAMISDERNYLARGIISLPQLRVLEHVAGTKQGCAMRSIARGLGMKPPTVTGLMDRLVALGLAKRYASEADRRGVLAEATPKGRRILDQFHAERRRRLMEAFGPLSARERGDYLAILEKVATFVEARKKEKAESGLQNE